LPSTIVAGLLTFAVVAGPAPAEPRHGDARAQAKKSKIPGITNMPYKPEPAIEAIPPQPDPAAVPKANPTKQYNAYDLNVFETIWFPHRQAGDADADAAPGGAVTHGNCPEGNCANHALEYEKFWLETMAPLVRPFGGVVHSYDFFSEGNGIPPGGPLASPAGDTFNLQATIPGDRHPEQMVIVSGHWDQTDSGPASAWDSAEGHATVFRIAKIMTDYWRKTGTRPDVSVKFTAWGAEEAGTFGSIAYVRDNLTPFPSLRVRGYFNLDPCAGAYPAYYRGNPADRVPMVMQLANPENQASPDVMKTMEDFNEQARVIVGDVFNHLDDQLTDVPTEPEIFVSDEEAEKEGIASQEPEIVTAVGGLAAFSSDYRNFEQIGVPIFNLFPDMFGPHADESYTGYRDDGIAMLHTPNDNLLTLNALTGIDQSGLTPSQGWYKGLELCAHMHSWFMLQPNMSSPVKRTTRTVAYFEGIPKEPAPIAPGKTVTLDAHGSYGFSNAKKMKLVPAKKLRYKWTFADGSKATGVTATRSFRKTEPVTLTVTAPGGRKDVMRQIVLVPTTPAPPS
ncbi:MAG TPA: M28 family peptidase, partial [Actinomycetota bacterium]